MRLDNEVVTTLFGRMVKRWKVDKFGESLDVGAVEP
jgi:hypothetical protein